MKTLYLFPDTNLFDECKALHEIDWGAAVENDHWVRLVVCRSIQSEIDHQKDRGYDRIGKRARAASKLFREIIQSADGIVELRKAKPRVTIEIRQDIRPAQSLADSLDYSEADDKLVGTAFAFGQSNPTFDVRILTHDTGPMASAKMVGQRWIPIPDEWLLPPETNEAEKKLAVAQAELEKLKKGEPSFQICLMHHAEYVSTIEGTVTFFPPLDAQKLSALVDEIQKAFPRKSDFELEKPKATDSIFEMNFSAINFERDVEQYKNDAYPNWVRACTALLRKVHIRLQHEDMSARCTFWGKNIGIRPGKNSLVTIKAHGNFLIGAPGRKKDTEEFPSPPTPPTRGLGAISNGKNYNYASTFFSPKLFAQSDRKLDQFYYKKRPEYPVKEIEFECALWRHATDPEHFDINLHLSEENQKEIVGALECVIRADNLSAVAAIKIPIRLAVVTGNTAVSARALLLAAASHNHADRI